MRAEIYQQNNPSDYSMLTQPKLKIGDTVIVWDKEEGGEWVQAEVIAAEFNRFMKCWTYEALTAFVDCPTTDVGVKPEALLPKEWYLFSDNELKRPLINVEIGKDTLNHYIVIQKQ